MIANPPDFLISSGCCTGAKKRTSKKLAKTYEPDLDVQGVRRAEGGARSQAYESCFDRVGFGCDRYRPIFWFTNEDKAEYDKTFDVTHSDCYTKYGLKRTGCACCPFGRDFEFELKVAEQFEPKLHRAALKVFGKSYEYTRKFYQFREQMNAK